tara:strand:- start:1219 stop:1632 length:414 start_codon:yes stop_codon:yes gene_type:complete
MKSLQIVDKAKRWFGVALGLISFSFTSCSNTPVQTLKNGGLTHGQVQMNVVVGSTTQNDILEAFGAPNITTISGDGREVWTYQRHATIARSSSSHATAVLIGTSASGFERSMKTMTFIVKFDKKKVVSDFKSMSSNF